MNYLRNKVSLCKQKAMTKISIAKMNNFYATKIGFLWSCGTKRL